MIKTGLLAEEYRDRSVKEILLDGWPRRRRSLILRLAFVVVIIVFAAMYWANPSYYTNYYSDGTPWFAVRKAAGTMFILAVLAVIAVIPNVMNAKLNRKFLVFCCFAVPFATFFSIEYLFHTDFFGLKLYKFLLNAVIIYLIYMIGIIATGWIRTGLFAGTSLICAFGYIAYYMNNFRGSPLLFSDLSNFGTGVEVLGEFDYTLDFRGYIFMVAIFAIMVVTSKISISHRFGAKQRIGIAVLMCAGWFGVIGDVVVSDHYTLNQMKVSTFQPMTSGYNTNGGLLALMRSAKISMVSKPDGYSAANAEKLADEARLVTNGEYPAQSEYNKPNVIAVMNESFTDVANIGEHINTNIDPLPFYHSLSENTVKGWAYASGLGGGTANSEFEFFTGNSLAFLPVNASPYQLYMKQPQPSLVSTLMEQGYQGNVALHPFEKSGYSRPRAYEMLGFEEFLDETDFKNPRMLRKYISDEADYDKIISLYEKYKKASDAPVFLWTITMQNHSSYSGDYANFTPDVTITDDLLPLERGENGEMDKILSLMRESDRATGELVNYFDNVDEPTVIVFFGDHQPRLPQGYYDRVLGAVEGKLTPEDLMKKYRVPFFIWANFDIEERQVERVSMNYLSSLMLDAAGMEMTDYNKFLLDMYKDVPCMTVFGHYGADGKFYSTESKIQNDPHANPNKKQTVVSSPQDEALYDYSVLQYNNLFDPKRHVPGFFSLSN
ncbi:MAG: LTA synthase family protein [Clostridiales Family XIII bacterium]|jgi:phosphoglycerol transferase MdoB-like AlkP superfamily enzyme|nr:LTA synthase family protein [Clostridiales Family XIII bacterium]